MLRLCPYACLNDLASARRQDHGGVRSFRLDHNLSNIGRVESARVNVFASAYRQGHGIVRRFRLDHNLSSLPPTVTSNAATMAARDFIFGHSSGQWNSSWALHYKQYKQDGNH
jgi:hypothetical protein